MNVKRVNRLIVTLVAVSVMSMLVVGCQNKKTADADVLDVTAPANANNAPSAYAPPAPIAAQPVTYDTMPNNTTDYGAPGAAGGSYTVKKGDTLYSIARTRYGDGKQWQKIASANPGLRPETLKVGQTITIP